MVKFVFGLPKLGDAFPALCNAVFDQVLTIGNMSILRMFLLVCICIFAAGTN